MVALTPLVLNTELKSVNGPPIKLSNYAGKVLVVNLWATWCGPCRMEIPELVKFHKEYRTKGLEVVGLSTENPEASAEGVRRFVQEYKMEYPVGWVTADVAIALMQGRDAIPQSFVIARDGRILKRFVGFSAAATPQQMRDAIEEALKG
jgi:thiol-disulfide isomerase/thioredoxin